MVGGVFMLVPVGAASYGYVWRGPELCRFIFPATVLHCYSAYYPRNDNSWVNTACYYLKKWRSVSLFHECSKTAPQIGACINAFWSIIRRHISTSAVRRRLQEPGERRATDSSHGLRHGKQMLDKWETVTYSSLKSSDLIWSEVSLFSSTC